MTIVIRIGLAALVLVSVTACGKKGDVKPPAAAFEEAGQETGVSVPIFAGLITFLAS